MRSRRKAVTRSRASQADESGDKRIYIWYICIRVIESIFLLCKAHILTDCSLTSLFVSKEHCSNTICFRGKWLLAFKFGNSSRCPVPSEPIAFTDTAVYFGDALDSIVEIPVSFIRRRHDLVSARSGFR